MSHRVLKNTNLKASEIRDALAAGGGIVNNNTLTFFKEAANINIWSKFKPVNVIYAPDFVQAFDPYRDYYDQYWWRGIDGDCGIDTQNTVAASISLFLDNVRQGNYYWVYKLPTKPFRLTDFCSYDIDAHCPVSGELADDYWIDDAGRLVFTFDLTTGLPDTNLTFDDILVTTKNGGLTTLSDYYLGILFWKEVGGVVTSMYYPTSTTKLGSDSVTIELDGLNGDAYYGEFYAIPYLSSAIQELNGSELEATYLTLNIAPKNIYIHAPGSLIYTIALASYTVDDSGNASISYSVEIKNNDSSSKGPLEIQLWVVRTSDGQAPAEGNTVSTPANASFTVENIPANSELIYFSTNYEDAEESLKIAPAFTVRSEMFDESSYTYWIASRAEGFITTYYQLELIVIE